MIRTAKDALRDVLGDVPYDTLKAMLLGAAQVDGRLGEAFALRYHSPRMWENRLSGLLAKMRSDLALRADAEASDTRSAVAAAVMRGSSGPPREPTAPNYNSMDDRTFKEKVKQDYGYRPKLD